MNVEQVKQTLLEYGWDAAERRHIAAILREIDSDEECRRAASEYDRIREVLAAPESDEEPIDGWEAFEERLTGVCRARRTWNWRSIAAVAASLLLALVGYNLVNMRGSPERPEIRASALAGLQFTPAEIRNNVSAFEEVADVFDRRASWLMLSQHASDLGLGTDPSEAHQHMLLFRLTLAHADVVISSADLIIIPGQTAAVTVPCAGGRQLRYHVATSSERPTRLTLWAELQTVSGEGETLAALATDLHIEPGQVFDAGEMVTSTGGYELQVSFSDAPWPGSRP
jgi:hypothetical protein